MFDVHTKNELTKAKMIGAGNQDLENFLKENNMKVKSMSVINEKGTDRLYFLLEKDE